MSGIEKIGVKIVADTSLVGRLIEDIQIVSAHAVGARVIAERLGVTAEYDALIASLGSELPVALPAGVLKVEHA